MKKLFSLLLVALISSQMWAATQTQTMKVYFVYDNGGSSTKDYSIASVTSVTPPSGYTITNAATSGTSNSNKYYTFTVSGSTPSTAKFTITISPASGWVPVKWVKGTFLSDTQIGSAGSSTLTASKSDLGTTNFALILKRQEITISATSAGNGTGQVSKTSGSGYTSSVSVTPSTTVYLKATPSSSSYVFDYWSNDQNSTKIYNASTSVTPSVATAYTAHFKVAPSTFSVSLSVSPAGAGTVSASPASSISSGGSSTLSVTSTESGYTFEGWYDENDSKLSGSSSYSLTGITTNRSIVAKFVPEPVDYTATPGKNDMKCGPGITIPNFSNAVDLGFNVLWAKMNVGAASVDNRGTSYTIAQALALTEENLGGAYWRLPTQSELGSSGLLQLNTKKVGNNVVFTRATGYDGVTFEIATETANITNIWTSTTSGTYYCYGAANKTLSENNMWNASKTTYDGTTNAWVRPVFDLAAAGIKKLTINVVKDGHTYTNNYYVANNQQVTITPADVDDYTSSWTSGQSGTGAKTFTVTANTSATITYEESISYVTATFNNWNGSLLEEYTDVESGTTPTYSGSDPTKPADETYTYAFSGWSPELDDITENTTYTAQFTPTYINYSVTFRTSEDDANPAVKSDYHYGDEITNCPAIDPQKIGDETHTYTFLGWYLDNTETRYEAGMTVSGNMMFTARFEEQIIEVVPVTYDVTIGSFAANGKVIITSQDNVREITATGATLTFDAGKSLTIQAVPNAYYHFAGWENNDEEAVIDIRTLNEDLTYTPTFAANEPLTLEDTHNEAYYSDLYNQHDGEVLTVTMEGRQLTEGSWMTFCVPFDFSIPAGHPFRGAVYAFQNATMSGTNTAAYISLDFRRTYEMKANVPYLIVPTMTTLSDLEFDHVTIEAAPAQETVTAESGQVQFISMPWQTTLVNDAQKPDFYLATGNNLRYVKTEGGTTFRAFRAYFHRLVNLGAAARRVVISLDGVETSKEIGEDGEIEEMTTKRMENGVLYIERNGVRYDAQGQRAE